MSEFEDKLGSILSNQDAMAQIMALAQSLGGSAPPPTEPAAPMAASPPPAVTAAPALSTAAPLDLGSLMGALGSVDPQVLQTGARLFSEFSQGDDDKTALLMALRPFLKEERYAKVDRAVQIARLSRVLRVAFQLFKGRGASDDV